MEKNSVWPFLRVILFLLQLFFQSMCTTLILSLDMLPDKYVILFIGAMVMLAICTGLLLFINVNGKIALLRKIVSGILVLLIVLGCGLICKFALDANKLVQNVTGNVTDTRKTYVLVLNDNAAQSVKDTKGYRYGVQENYDVEHTQQMIAAVEQELGDTLDIQHYTHASVMVNALYNKEVDALIMNGVSISLLTEQPAFEDLLSRVRLVHNLPYQDVQTDKKPEKESVEKPFVLYISGSDTRSALLKVSRSDVNILAVVNPNTKQVLLVNTPRDYYVPNPAGKGALDKLTHCSNYGVDCSVEALENLYNTQVDYYGQINFVGFEKLIDAIGGITVYSDQSFTAITGDYFKKGENTINGEKALAFARERYNVSGGDNTRGKNQMKVIGAVIEKMTSSKTLVSNYSNILKSLEGMFVTNFTAEEISDLVKMQMNDMTPWNVQSYAVTGKGGSEETYSWKGELLYVMWPNQDTVDHAKELINRVLKGEVLTEADMTVPS